MCSGLTGSHPSEAERQLWGTRATLHQCLPEMMSTTVSAALVTRGLPAKVDPWSPGFMLSATCCFTSTAPMGSPPAK